MRLRAPAKINLTLDITGVREDGYHLISSVMQQVSLYDTVELRLNSEGSIRISSNVRYIPCDGRNICWKAAERYFQAAGLTGVGADIYIRKIIPTSAGLAGGSSDGAAVMLGLEQLTHALGPRLAEISGSVGADLPFCIKGGTCLCEGIGDILTPISRSRSNKIHIAVAKNTRGLSTPAIYSLYDSKRREPPVPDTATNTERLVRALERGDIQAVCGCMRNALEEVSAAEKPEIMQLKREMLSLGAINAMMSGSGPSVFGIFPDEDSAKYCVRALKSRGMTAYHAYFL